MHVDSCRPRQRVANQAWRERRLLVATEPDVRAAHQAQAELAAMPDHAVCEVLGKDARQAATGATWPGHR